MKIITYDLIFYCTHNQLCVLQYISQCLEYLGYITLIHGMAERPWSLCLCLGSSCSLLFLLLLKKWGQKYYEVGFENLSLSTTSQNVHRSIQNWTIEWSNLNFGTFSSSKLGSKDWCMLIRTKSRSETLQGLVLINVHQSLHNFWKKFAGAAQK